MRDCISWCNPVFKRVQELPDVKKATLNHTYILPDGSAFILNENLDGFVPLTKNKVKEYNIVSDSELISFTKDSTDDVVIFNLDSSALLTKFDELDNRIDNIPIYDDSELRRDIAQLKTILGEVDDDTIFDPTEILNKISEIENRLNSFRSYDDTSIRQEIARIKEILGDVDNDTIFDPTDILARLDVLERKTDNDTKYTAGAGLVLTGTEFKVSDDIISAVPALNALQKTVQNLGVYSEYLIALQSNFTVFSNDLGEQRRKMTYNSSTNIGIIHLDIINNSSNTGSQLLGTLPSSSPTPRTLIESQVYYGTSYITFWIEANSRNIMCAGMPRNVRFIVDVIGYFN